MSEEGGLMMFRGFHSKATNSLFALILHIVFNLLSLFSIIFCPPPRPPALYPYYLSPRKTLHLVLPCSSWKLFHFALNRQQPEKNHIWNLHPRGWRPTETLTRPSLFSGCPSAGDHFGWGKGQHCTAQPGPRVSPPNDTRYEPFALRMGNVRVAFLRGWKHNRQETNKLERMPWLCVAQAHNNSKPVIKGWLSPSTVSPQGLLD